MLKTPNINIENNRVYGLDILRFFAIFFVIFGHASGLLPEPYSKIHERLLPFDGVTIFFVLSGYLIGGILLKIINQTDFKIKDLTNFWTRRWMRTLPAYYFTLFLLTTPRLILDPNFHINSEWRHYFFLQNIYMQSVDFFPESWSLTVEEWFYLTFPISIFILFKIIKNKNIVIITTILSFIFISLLVRYKIYTTERLIGIDMWDAYFRKTVVTRLDSLMFGVLGAYFAYYNKDLWLKYKKTLLFISIPSFIIISVFVPTITNAYSCVFYFSIISISVLLSLPYLSTYKMGNGNIYKAITITSIISYSLYLLNYSFLREFLIFDIIHNKIYTHFHLNVLTTTIIDYITYWMLLFIMAFFMYKYIEQPIMRLRDRISK
jgi:peptidoglycan/LPS O-acetylase OafA/YrhL